MQQATTARCSLCGINYPPFKSVCEVRSCGERLSYFSNDLADEDWEERVRLMNEAHAAGEPTDGGLRAYRVGRFEELGFPDYAAEVLADAQDGDIPLWPGRAASELRRGATHGQVLRIFA